MARFAKTLKIRLLVRSAGFDGYQVMDFSGRGETSGVLTERAKRMFGKIKLSDLLPSSVVML